MTWAPLPSAMPGVKTQFKVEPGSGEYTVHRTQDCSSIIERNKAMQTADRPSTRMGAGPIASIPLVVIEQWGRELGFPVFALPPAERRAFITKKLRHSDWRYLRTSERM